jgi:hypothetical protein
LADNTGEEDAMRLTPADTGKQLGESDGGMLSRLRIELREKRRARQDERALKRALAAKAMKTEAQRRNRRHRTTAAQPPAIAASPASLEIHRPVLEPEDKLDPTERRQPQPPEQPDPLANKQVAERAEALERRVNAAERLMQSIEERQSQLNRKLSTDETGQMQRRFSPARSERDERPVVPSTPAPGRFRWTERSRGTIVSPPSRPERPEGERRSEGEQSGGPADRGQEQRPRFPGEGGIRP